MGHQVKIGQIAAMQHKPSAGFLRQIRAQKRALRRAKRGLSGAAYERRRLALKSLTEMEEHPLRPGLGVQVAMNIASAGA